jgi:hypothetical protein
MLVALRGQQPKHTSVELLCLEVIHECEQMLLQKYYKACAKSNSIQVKYCPWFEKTSILAFHRGIIWLPSSLSMDLEANTQQSLGIR